MYKDITAKQDQNVQVLPPKALMCSRHFESITNYSIERLQPLCPECVQDLFQNYGEDYSVNSLKNVKISCSQKIRACINELNRQKESSEVKFLWNPQSIIDEGASELNKCKSQLIKIVEFYFESLQTTFMQKVHENMIKANGLSYVFDNIRQSITELEQLYNSLESGNTIAAITKTCQLDLLTLVNKVKSDIHKIIDSRDLEPIKIQVQPNALVTFKELLPSLVVISKQFHQNPNTQQQQYQQEPKNPYQPKNSLKQENLLNFQQPGANQEMNKTLSLNDQFAQQQKIQEYQIQQLQNQLEESKKNNLTEQKQLPIRQPNFFDVKEQIPDKKIPFQPKQASNQKVPQSVSQNKKDPIQPSSSSSPLLIEIENKILYGIDLDLFYAKSPAATFQIPIKEELPVDFAMITTSKGDIFIVGGIIGQDITNQVLRLSISPKRNSCKIELVCYLSEPCYASSLIELDKRIYVIGGISQEGQCKSKVEIIQYQSNSFKVLLDSECQFPSARPSLTVFQNNKIVKIGGVDEEGQIMQNFEIYDSQKREWQIMDLIINNCEYEFSMNYGAGCVAINDKEIMVFGGSSGNNNSDMCFSLVFQKGETEITNIMKFPLPFLVEFIYFVPCLYRNRIVFLEQSEKKQVVSFSGSNWVLDDGQ